ncbi:hypothetical protein SMICM17S_05526 [Streptomyces microflavus]
MRAHDGRRGGSPALLARLHAVFGPAEGLPGLLDPRSDRPAVLASFAPEVAACAGADEVAAGILREAATHIAEAAAAVCPARRIPRRRRLRSGPDRRAVPDGRAAGLALRKELARLVPQARVTIGTGDPLSGALRIARALADGRPAAAARTRRCCSCPTGDRSLRTCGCGGAEWCEPEPGRRDRRDGPNGRNRRETASRQTRTLRQIHSLIGHKRIVNALTCPSPNGGAGKTSSMRRHEHPHWARFRPACTNAATSPVRTAPPPGARGRTRGRCRARSRRSRYPLLGHAQPGRRSDQHRPFRAARPQRPDRLSRRRRCRVPRPLPPFSPTPPPSASRATSRPSPPAVRSPSPPVRPPSWSRCSRGRTAR